MDLEQFNQLNVEQAMNTLQPCVHIGSWIQHLIQQRPFTSTDALYQTAAAQAQFWQWSEISNALAQHPRIGEKKAAIVLSNKERQFSQKEQSQLDADIQLQQALYQGNLAYEHKFGHIFLIRAAGRSGIEMLAELNRRLKNTNEQEQQEVKQQLSEIALIRLKQEIQ
ncbi:2-oxo-4-hydroxy-4-carboxy-5-ureidoimidazoline decarboxylase [Acinetobacter sp. NIPH 2699]|uniref:2-oxo-4-hydroxy-4-carboxy-5-ureidoimidazoline decarboxylase n=1 Tax=Acinetobacter sp. NIPH 2699 TaxID=2923433 RepID=UPI001F4AE581|nr:2-oxo-4-hydroxy-4-carboxy-5-ureidoimidazoline decarboxylase [Acinetobacter sp. NIPH 2699]MCH7337185.1 2-oxo-4-hydroxy-4-carboxy-5-ureidoimidazoline decarboxylase [Acinetobacter sp. NIPH 2699]